MAIDKKAFTSTRYPNIKLHKDGIKFFFDFTINKKRYNRVWSANKNHTKPDKLRSAVKQLEVERAKVEHQNGITADIDATIDHYWKILLEDKSKDTHVDEETGKATKVIPKWSDHWMLNNTKFYDKYIKDTLGSKKIREVKPAMISGFNRTISHLAPRTQKTAYELLVPIFALAAEDEIIVHSPIKKRHKPVRKQAQEKKTVNDAEVKYRKVYGAIHQVFNTDDLVTFKDGTTLQCTKDPHYRAIFLFGFHGRRKTETLELHWEDVNFANNKYTIRAENSKVNLDMTFKLPQDVKSALLEFKEDKGRIFEVTHIERHYKKIRKVTGIDEFTFHWMRNLAVSALASMGENITDLSALLGHTDDATIRKYLSLQREASTARTNEASLKLLSQGGS